MSFRGSPSGSVAAVTGSLLTVSGYTPMSNEKMSSPRDGTLRVPAARVPSSFVILARPSTNTQSPAWMSVFTGQIGYLSREGLVCSLF